MRTVGITLAFAAMMLCGLRAGRAQSAGTSAPQAAPDAAQSAASQAVPASDPSPPLPVLSTTSSSEDIQVALRQGFDALQKHDLERSLAAANEVIAVRSRNALAYNLAGASQFALHEYAAAVISFQRALDIQPAEPHSLGGLMNAYTLAGMTEQRDAERRTLEQMARDGLLPVGFHYFIDAFDSGDKKVQVIEFPHLWGKFNYRYFFNVLDAQGKLLYRVALESDDFDQVVRNEFDPEAAASGRRRFSLDGYKSEAGTAYHFTYAFFDSEPTYEEVRKQVLEIVAGTRKPRTSSHRPLKETLDPPPGSAGSAPDPKR